MLPSHNVSSFFSPSHLKVLKAQTQAKKKGFSDVIFLDSVNKRFLEEASSCNIFIIKVSIQAKLVL